MAAALAELAKLRARVRRLGRFGGVLEELSAPDPERAPTSPGERLLGPTSSAARWGMATDGIARRGRWPMRTRRMIEGRLASDMFRERPSVVRLETTRSLHKTRAA